MTIFKIIPILAICFINNIASAEEYTDRQNFLRLLDRVERLEQNISNFESNYYNNQSSNNNHDNQSNYSAASLDLSTKIDELEERLRGLTGSMEQFEHNLNLEKDRLTKLQEDIEYRLTELEKNKDTVSTTKEKTLDKQKNQTAPSGEDIPKAKPDTPNNSVTTQNKSDTYINKSEFDKAFALIKQSKYKEAQTAFNKFIEKNPNDPLVSNSYYWLGESYFAQKNYEQAAIFYLKGYKKFPQGAKAPESLLKLATTLDKLKKTSDACITLKKLSENFPELPSNLATKAQSEASRIGCK